MNGRPGGHGGCKSGEVREEDTWTQSKTVGQRWSVSEMKGWSWHMRDCEGKEGEAGDLRGQAGLGTARWMTVSIPTETRGRGMVLGPSNKFCLGHRKHGYMVPDPELSPDPENTASRYQSERQWGWGWRDREKKAITGECMVR